MKNIQVLIISALIMALSSPALAKKEPREEKQTRLDAACEVVREKKLVPMRARFVKDCVANKELPSQKECETFYADYGGRMGGRAPLFYDLPECVTAFEFQQGVRKPG